MTDLVQADLRELINTSKPFQNHYLLSGNLLNTEKAILKFTPISICEVIGYQLATFFKVPTPRMQGVWTDSLIQNSSLRAAPYRVGILIEYFEGIRYFHLDHLINIDPDLAANIIVLSYFSRDEWGEIINKNEKFYLVDLEQYLPYLMPEILFQKVSEEKIKYLEKVERMYNLGNNAALNTIMEQIAKYNLDSLVLKKIGSIFSASPEELGINVSVSGYPSSELLSAFFSNAFLERINYIADFLGKSKYENIKWENYL